MVAGVTPFLRRVLPAGILKAMTKPVGCKEAYGLVQVSLRETWWSHTHVNTKLMFVWIHLIIWRNISTFLSVQVNNKFYNHARVLLGGIGSLHPANRLAAYITGRLRAPGGTALSAAQKPDPIKKVNAPEAPPEEGARTAVPPTTVARTTEPKTAVQPPGKTVFLTPMVLSTNWFKGRWGK